MVEVPFLDDDTVDHRSFDRLLDHLVGTGVRALMFPGFASEFHKLSDDERAALQRAFLRHTAAAPSVAGVVSVPDHATHLAVRRAREAVEQGADAINILPPFFLAPSAAAVQDHLHAVLAAVADVPAIVQYAPAQTGTALTVDGLADLASEHPNLRTVKVESVPPGRLVSALLDTKPALSALVGYGGVQLPDAVARGAVGVQPGCSFTELYLEIWAAYERDEVHEAESLHQQLLPYLAYWMQHVELIVAAEKSISYRRGLIASPRCRAPGWVLDGGETSRIDAFLRTFASRLE